MSVQVGAQVMCLKNLDFASGLVNGARGVVVALVSNGTLGSTQLLPEVKFVCGETRVMGKEVWAVYEGDKVRVPVALAVEPRHTKLTHYIHMHMHMHMHTDVHIHTYTCTYTYTCMHKLHVASF
jgi:hypothetical protein